HNIESIWSIAVIMATLRRVGYEFAPDELCHFLTGLYRRRQVGSVSEYFSYLIHADRDDYFRAKGDLEAILVPAYKRAVTAPIAIFIDNIDEYFNKHLDPAASESVAGALEPELWYTAQMGLVLSFFNLHKFNHHVKLFASIRKEAIARYKRDLVLFQQVGERVLELRYSALELERIFINNLRREPRERFVLPALAEKDPLTAWFGFSVIKHKQVKCDEDVFQYIARHTLSRPRDFMQMGKALSRLAPEERSQESVRTVVQETSADIVGTYLSEVRPHVESLDMPRLLSLVDTNALERGRLRAICREYNALVVGGKAGAAVSESRNLWIPCEAGEDDCALCEGCDVFGVLYKLGFLGYLIDDGSKSTRIQKFVLPGERTFEGGNLLPDSTLYLLHPILNSTIMERNRTYIGNRNKRNIIGNGLLWHLEDEKATRRKYAALKADVCGFSKIMEQGAVRTLALKKKLSELATAENLGIESVSHSEGDAVSGLDRSAERVAEAAFRLLDAVRRLGLQVRVALDHGYMTVAASGAMTGTPFLHSARVEPLVEPDQVWCTEAFAKELERLGSLYRVVDLGDNPPASLAGRAGEAGFRVGKDGQAELELRLFRIVRD
ncbi:MAG: hypothetical protein JXA15_14100, partial [Spirochaetales bacterium]|nr:hypothetical protein [Spirochaetales bacterium]